MNETVLATLNPSPGRRYFAVGALGLLGVMVLWLAATAPAHILSRLFLVLVAFGALALMRKQWRATTKSVELTATEIREASGAHIAYIADITGVERGPFAFKPSGGFLLRQKTPQPRAWAPGLWWRLGRSVGVGGVTVAHEGKAMAEQIQGLIAARDV